MGCEVLDSLQCRSGGIYVDGTVGGGGHAYEILKKTSPDGILIGIDIDEEALKESEERLKVFGKRKILIKGNFADIDTILSGLNIREVDGILLDLGVSSHQLDTIERGFSFRRDAPLDMRMDKGIKQTAYDVVHTLSEEELERIIREFGEEKMAGRIARMIVKRRKVSPIKTTSELADVIVCAIPPHLRSRRIHPATKTFQAIRIYVNDELMNLHNAIHRGVDRLKRSGRFSILSFHSLEDRIVKNTFRVLEKGCVCAHTIPRCVCKKVPKLKVITRKPITAQRDEIEANPRARSAKLRTAERV